MGTWGWESKGQNSAIFHCKLTVLFNFLKEIYVLIWQKWKENIPHVWSEAPSSSHIANTSLSSPTYSRIPPSPPKELLESLCYLTSGVNSFSWLPWSFCSCPSLFRGQLKATPLPPAASHCPLFPGCQYLVSNCWCLCQQCYFLPLLKPAGSKAVDIWFPHCPLSVVFLNGRNFSHSQN